MNRFGFVGYAQEIIAGPRSLTAIGEAVTRFGWQRLMLCTSPSFQRNGRIAEIRQLLGDRLICVYDSVEAHVQDYQLLEAAELGHESSVDAIIGLGGGSAIGLAKALSLTLEAQRTGHEARAAYPTDQPLIAVIAIPTTYAGSEMTSVYGVTHHENGTSRKITVRDPKIVPKLVIYDPELTLALPPEITASSGINALAHCIEALYSTSRHPLAIAAALAGVQIINRTLPQCVENGSSLEARTEMLAGAHLAGYALATTSMSLHHGLCHVLGGSANVPHGIANAIILPHAVRFNVDVTAPQLAIAARAIGIATHDHSDLEAAQALVVHLYQFIHRLGLPQHLRDTSVKHEELPHLAQLALESKAVRENPKRVTSAAQLEALFEAAW